MGPREIALSSELAASIMLISNEKLLPLHCSGSRQLVVISVFEFTGISQAREHK
jgi:hypothetical protein